MNIVRELIDWKDYKIDGAKIFDKLDKGIDIGSPIALEGVLSNKSKYNVFILNKPSNNVEVMIDIIDENGEFYREGFLVSKMCHLLKPYTINFNDYKYILRFDINDVESLCKESKSDALSRVNSIYLQNLMIWYDFNVEEQLVECLFLFLKNSVLLSNTTYDLLKNKLEYFGYDKDFMLELEKIAKLNLEEIDTKQLCINKLLYETLFELIENTFIHNYHYRYDAKEAKEVYERYLNAIK